MKTTIIRIGLLIIVSAVTLLTLMYVQPFIYASFQSEFGRHKVINDVLLKSKKINNIIIFGDSRAMFGIDARIIKKNSSFDGEIYNLSSVAQSPYEAGYFYSKISKTTRTVIQCVSPAFFSRNMKNNIPDEKAISLFLSGYRIDKKNIYGNNYCEFFKNSDFKNYFESRSYYKSYFNTFMRKFFDNEKFNEHAFYSHYFPNPVTLNKHPQYPFFKYDCGKYKTINYPESQVEFIKKSKKYFKSIGVNYVLLILPINPDECNESYDTFDKLAVKISDSTDVKIINLAGLLRDNRFFYDGLHCNKKGAEIISQVLSDKLE